MTRAKIGVVPPAGEGPWAGVNFRYACYCVANGVKHPSTMMVIDANMWPGVMTGFILWAGKEQREWKDAIGFPDDAPMLDCHHKAYDLWLADRWCAP